MRKVLCAEVVLSVLFLGFLCIGSSYVFAESTDKPKSTPTSAEGVRITPTIPVKSGLTITPTIPTSGGTTTFALAIGLQGIGNGGDVANPTSKGNPNPLHPTRAITLSVFDASNVLTQSYTGQITYDSASGLFNGSVAAPILAQAQYKVLLFVPGYLKKWSSAQPITISQNQQVNVSGVSLVTGDIIIDNTLDVIDYNMLTLCYGQRQHTPTCLFPVEADLNDDGVVDGIDYNILLREYPAQNGDTYIVPSGINLTPTPPVGTPLPTQPGQIPPTTYQKGIPQTPPMGADPWAIYHDDNSILNEKYFTALADFMHTQKFSIWDGSQKTMQEVGYNYVTIDDAWGGLRTASGLQPNVNYFPNMLNSDPNIGLIAHVHSLGLKFGLYTSTGDVTCVPSKQGQIPGSRGYEAIDGQEFQNWGIDYLKLDWCGSNLNYSQASVQALSQLWSNSLGGPNKTILEYINTSGGGNPWTWAATDNSANTWRVALPVQDAWSGTNGSVMDILDNSHLQQSHASPHHWTDANYLEAGVGNLTLDESKSEFSLWAMVTSQLIAGADMLKMHVGDIPSQVLFNTEIIALDQDPLIVQATKKTTVNGIEVWEKALSGNAYAVAFLNTNNSATSVNVPLTQIGLPGSVTARDLWQHKSLGTISGTFTTTSIPAHGVQVIRAQ